MPKKMSKETVAKLAVLGASLAGIAAGAYFVFGPKGKKNRAHAASWAIKMKGEVVEKLEAAKEITEPIYLGIIDAVTKEYTKGKKASQPEIEALAADLKRHWKSMSKLAMAAKADLTKGTAKIVKATKKAAPRKKA